MTPPPRRAPNGAPVLLVIGVHREELAFGRAVAAQVDPARVAVLTIPEGLSGRRPHPDQSFHYDTLHRALYLQLLPHVVGRHPLLIDLHTGLDQFGPRADLICADAALRACLGATLARRRAIAAHDVRLVALGDEGTAALHARTVIPRQVWDNPAFRYVGLEIYMPAQAAGEPAACRLARDLIGIVADCVEAGIPTDSPERAS